LVAGGSFVGTSDVTIAPVAIAPLAIRHAPAPIVEPVHAEPGPEVAEVVPIPNQDVTGLRFPSGLTIPGGSKHRVILFTFDDGPSRRNTPRLLDMLDDLGIKAVFFVKSESFGSFAGVTSSAIIPRPTVSFRCSATPRSRPSSR
jgi:hypothetical protein